MSRISYTVTVAILYRSKAAEWLEWMRAEHIAAVMAGGAQSATIVKLDPEREGQAEEIYEIQYIFKDRGSFEAYLTQHAPRLRREGLEKFPLTDGFKYHRRVGEILT